MFHLPLHIKGLVHHLNTRFLLAVVLLIHPDALVVSLQLFFLMKNKQTNNKHSPLRKRQEIETFIALILKQVSVFYLSCDLNVDLGVAWRS